VADARWDAVATRVGLGLQLAEAESNQGKLAEAKASMRGGLEDNVKGKTASPMFSARTRWVRCCWMLENSRAPKERFRELANIESAGRRPDPVLVTRGVRNLGIVLHRDGRLHPSLAELERALKLYETAYGQEHVENAPRPG
jgi:hypothetical protein